MYVLTIDCCVSVRCVGSTHDLTAYYHTTLHASVAAGKLDWYALL